MNYVDVSTQPYEYTGYPRPPWLPVSPHNVEEPGDLRAEPGGQGKACFSPD
jgi:hypothetical protein